MNPLVNQVSQLNSYGVALLASGDRSNAVRAFRSTLETLNNVASSYHSRNKVFRCTSVEAFALKSSSCQDPNLSILSIFPQASLSAEESTAGGDWGEFFVYKQAFHLDELSAAKSLSSFEAQICFYSSVILFNMALAFHLKDNGTNTKAQRKALSIYNVGMNIVKDIAKDNNLADQCTNRDVNNLLIAFLNNKAHIYFELSDFVMLQDQLSRMKEKLAPRDKFVYDHQQMQGFLINMALLGTAFGARAA